MNIDISVGNLFTGLTTLTVGVIAWMLRSIYADFKIAIGKIEDHSIKLAVLEEKEKQCQADVTDLARRLSKLEG